jgi:hypothetical protein
MQESEESSIDFRPAQFRDALMASISRRGRMGREQLLDMVFKAYDRAMADLVRSGKIVVEKSPENESHLDMFVCAKMKKR